MVERAETIRLNRQDNRRQQLISDFVDLRWLHAELGLPPLPLTHPHHFPISLLPDRAKEETPGAHATYEKLFARFMATYKEDSEIEVEEKGLDDLQPEVGLINWIADLSSLVYPRSWNLLEEEKLTVISGTTIKRPAKRGSKSCSTRSNRTGSAWRSIKNSWTPSSTSTGAVARLP